VVTTLALLLGVPLPARALGAPIASILHAGFGTQPSAHHEALRRAARHLAALDGRAGAELPESVDLLAAEALATSRRLQARTADTAATPLLGAAVAVALAATAAVGHPVLQRAARTAPALLAVVAVHPLLLFSSSYVEEEHFFWYFAAVAIIAGGVADAARRYGPASLAGRWRERNAHARYLHPGYLARPPLGVIATRRGAWRWRRCWCGC